MGKLQKIDNRINFLIKSGVENKHRSMVVMFGEKSQDQVPILHHIYQNISKNTSSKILWCYKKDLAFSTHRKKNMKLLNNRRKAGLASEGTIFEQFICANSIRWCYYSETQNILGQTFDICVLQDFEALTPNCLARTIETVTGGGIIVFLLKSVDSLKQFCTLSMDVHSRYRTEAHQDVVCRFNERFLLSLAYNERCIVLDDKWQIFPLSMRTLKAIDETKSTPGPTANTEELQKLKTSLKEDGSFFAPIIELCATLDQSKCILQGARAISRITKKQSSLFSDNDAFNRAILVITASRGRGKSAALGLCLSTAIEAGLPNIFATAPVPENLGTAMEFAIKGLKALSYQEHVDFNVTRENDSIIKIEIIKRSYRQVISYINPWDAAKQASLNVNSVDLTVIDEAASIPLVLLKKIIPSPKLVFMASTVNGYEGTGRSLSYKLLSELRSQCKQMDTSKPTDQTNLKPFDHSTVLFECTMSDAIRYAEYDCVEKWLNELLCLDCEISLNTTSVPTYFPPVDQCQLYYINRDTLFSYHKASEGFLKRLMSLYVASHYKNSPNDLQMLSDAPSHHLFCLLPPYDQKSGNIPEVLVVIQVCLEGQINRDIIMRSLARGLKPAGDLVPWIVSQQFCCNDFGSLSGARIIRIATHPSYQSVGYGTRAMQLLTEYYAQEPAGESVKSRPANLEEEDISDDDTQVINNGQTQDNGQGQEFEKFSEKSIRSNEKGLPPLLSRLSERPNEKLDYLGVSFGITPSILKFWKRANFFPVYLRQKLNPITGEYSCVMLKKLRDTALPGLEDNWDRAFFEDFRNRFFNLCPGSFRCLDSAFALELISNKLFAKTNDDEIGKSRLSKTLTPTDLRRLHLYVNSLIDYPVINDLVPVLSRLFFQNNLPSVRLTITHQIVLFSLGLQHKSIEDVALELERNAKISNDKLRRKSELYDENAFASILSGFQQFNENSTAPADGLEKTEKSNTNNKEDAKSVWPKRVKGFFFSIIKEIVSDVQRILKIEYDDDEEALEELKNGKDSDFLDQIDKEENGYEAEESMQIDQDPPINDGEIDKRKNLVMELLTKETSMEQLESCSVRGSDLAWCQNTAVKGKDLHNVKISEKDINNTQSTLDLINKNKKRPMDSQDGKSHKKGKFNPKKQGKKSKA